MRRVLVLQLVRELELADSLPGVEGRPFRWPGVARIAAATLEPSNWSMLKLGEAGGGSTMVTFVFRRGVVPADQSRTANPAPPANMFNSPVMRTPEASERNPDDDEAEVTERASLSSGSLSVPSGSAVEARVRVRSGTD